MKCPARHRLLLSKKRIKKRLVMGSMIVCSGAFVVLYVVSDPWRREGKPGIESLPAGGLGQESGTEEVEAARHAKERLLATSFCTDAVDSGGMAALYIAGVLYCFLGLAIVCDEFFQTSLETIADVLGLTPDVAGATFLAAGSSAPELFTSLADAFGDANSTGTGTIVGSAMFNILVIVALSAAVAGRNGTSIHIDWRPVCRDIIFYSFSIAILALVFLDEEVKWWEGLIMFLAYAIYIVFMKFNSRIFAYCQPPKIGIADDKQVGGADMTAAVEAVAGAKRTSSLTGGPVNAHSGTAEGTAKGTPPQSSSVLHAEEGEAGVVAAMNAVRDHRKSVTLGVRHRVDRNLSRAVSGTSEEGRPLVLVDHNQATADEENNGTAGQAATVAATATANGKAAGGEEGEKPGDGEEEDESRFTWPDSLVDQVLFVLGLPLLLALTLTIPDCGKPRWRQFYVVSFLMSLVWIAVLAHYMVVWVTAVGCFLEVSPIFMGLVVLAVGTSVPDAIGSMIAARGGEANMAIANAIGSNVFDILIGLGFPWFLRGVWKGNPMPVDRNGIALNVIVLFCTAILFVAVLALNDWSMTKKTGIFLFVMYLAYVIFVILSEIVF